MIQPQLLEVIANHLSNQESSELDIRDMEEFSVINQHFLMATVMDTDSKDNLWMEEAILWPRNILNQWSDKDLDNNLFNQHNLQLFWGLARIMEVEMTLNLILNKFKAS